MRYRGRIAPSPTGLLHVGHACTFWTAYQRAVASGGTLVFRNEDLDPQRSKADFATAMIEDLRWLGIPWQEGPDVGGPFGPTNRACDAASISMLGANCVTADLFIPAPARAKTSRWRQRRQTKVTMSRCIPADAANESARPATMKPQPA